MAVDQATFQAALADFASDLSAVIAANPTPGNAPDFTDELNTLNSIKAQFDGWVAALSPVPTGNPEPSLPVDGGEPAAQ